MSTIIAKASQLAVVLIGLPLFSSCASVPAERKVKIQEIGHRGLAVGVVTRLFVDSRDVDKASGKELHDLLVAESSNAGVAFKQSVKKALESRGVPIRESAYLRSGDIDDEFRKRFTCRQIASAEKYEAAAMQKPSADKCAFTAKDGKSFDEVLPYLATTWDEPFNENAPKAAVDKLSATIKARYLLLFYYSGYERSEDVKKNHAALKALTLLSPQGLADAIAGSVAGTVDETRLYSAVVYDTDGGRLRRVLGKETITNESFVSTDPRAWTEEQVKKYLIDDIVKDDVRRR